MASSPNFTIPKPPDNADLRELHTYVKDLYTFMVNNWQAGLQVPFFSQSQINQMNTLSQAGKLFFNNDTGKMMVGEVEAGALAVKTITTS